MPKVRANASARWVRRAAAATEDYKAGVENPRADWQQSTIAAAPIQAAAIQQAIAAKRFEKGVAKAGNQKWQSRAASKGAQRFAGGVSDAQADYQSAVEPYLQTIASTTLPPRGPKGDPKNLERVRAMNVALFQKKQSGG